MAEQMPMNLPARIVPKRDDFFITDSNRVAVAMLDQWTDWPSGKLLLIGPKGSGKTHLAHVWANDTGGRIIAARGLSDVQVPDLASGPVCVEDVQTLAGLPGAEAALFHLHNLCHAEGQPLLMTGGSAPRGWPLTLRDLASRLEATATVALQEPDDPLLTVVLARLFQTHHTVPAADVIPYLVRVMPRSFEMAHRVVAEIDRSALGTRTGVTRAKAKRALRTLGLQT